MSLPGATVTRGTRRAVRTLPTDTGQAFMAATTQRGPVTVQQVLSLSDWVAIYGTRETDSYAYDAVDTYFQLGGRILYFSRVVGTTPVLASKALSDGSGTAVTVRAKEYGAVFSAFTVAVAASGGNFTITLVGTKGDGTAVTESYGPYATVADLIAANPSAYVDFVLGTGVDPVTAGAATLTTTTGTDDRATVTTTHQATATAKFQSELGPGTLLLPNVTSSAGHATGYAHAESLGRWFAADAVNTPTVATLTALLTADNLLPGAWAGAVFGPWLVVQGVTAGTTRIVPAAPAVAGLAARNDGRGLSPNKAIAGRNGILESPFVVGLAQGPWTEAERDTLNTAGFNVIRAMLGGFRVYGFRTANQSDADWQLAGNARFFTKLRARALAIAEDDVFDEINGKTLSALHGALLGMLSEYFPDSLVPDDTGTPASAFDVDMSENDAASAAAETIHATLLVRMAGMAERIPIKITKVSLGASVAG